MDLQSLSTLFSTTYNPDPNVRKAAEVQIRKIGREEGMISSVLRIIAADSIDGPTRQACAVWLKNRVHVSYTVEKPRRPDQAAISDREREALRINILPLLAASDSRNITLQLANVLKTIIAHDFPSRWSGLIAEIRKLVSSNSVNDVHAGCIAALEAVRAFRFRQKNDILPDIVNQLFPALVNIGTQMVRQPPGASQEIPIMLHLILKTYRTTIVVNLSQHQQSNESLVPWGQLLFAVVNLRLPKDVVPADIDDREKCEWWKAKKWAFAVLGRLFHRYGNPSQMPSAFRDDYIEFADRFVSTFVPEILNTYLRQVELYVSNQEWLSSKCQYQIFHFFTECVKPKSTWVLLKPHFDTLVSNFIFPHLSFNESRRALWDGDPVDYIRVSADEYHSFSTPVAAATTFLLALASNRTKTTFLPILGFINNVVSQRGPPEQRFGALNMMAALGKQIMQHPQAKNSVERFLLECVSQELESPKPYLVAIALEIFGTVTKQGFEWSSEELLGKHFQATFRSLDHEALPVRVNAALALTEMIIAYESVHKAVSPQVGKIIQDLLKMSDETDLEILNNSMDTMVEQFPDEILPVAAMLTARLCESYLRLARETAIQDHLEDNAELDNLLNSTEEDDKTFTAMGVAKTIGTIISSIDDATEVLAQVQEVVIPIIVFTFENRLLDLFDNMYDLVDSLTYKLQAISSSMWPVFELTYKLFKHDAIDFLQEMLPSLVNFIMLGTEHIKTRPVYQHMLVDIYKTSITNEQLGENDRVNGSQLIETTLLSLRGHLDEHLQSIVSTALTYMDKIETNALQLANLNVLINCVLYNPSAALHFVEAHSPGMARTFFNLWFTAINSIDNRLPRLHDKNLTIIALCALLEMPTDTIPERLREGWPGIVPGILKVFKTIPKAVEERKQLEDFTPGEQDIDDVDGLNLEGEDEDVWDAESDYMEVLAAEGARRRKAGPEEEEEEEDEEDIEEDLGYISPLDTAKPYTTFKQSLTTFQMQNPQGYQAATALDIEQQTLLMEVMRKAEQE